MARKFKRITDPNIATKSLATCNEKYRSNILSCMQQAMYYPHLRLSAVLQKLIPEAEVSHLIDILVQQSDTLTNVTRKIIKYDLCVNVRTLFAIRNLFNIKDKDTEINARPTRTAAGRYRVADRKKTKDTDAEDILKA